MVTSAGSFPISDDQVLYAVPTNVGPAPCRTTRARRSRVSTRSTMASACLPAPSADPFFIDLGGVLRLPEPAQASVAPVLSAAVDGDDHNNYAPNALAGFNVNSIVLEVPITMLTSDGQMHAAATRWR
jgi:hypothetical protein